MLTLLVTEGGERMGSYVLGLDEIDRTRIAEVGGKAAHLGELSRIEGISVPAGVCVTTGAFDRALASVPVVDERLDQLSHVHPDDRDAIRALSGALRRALDAAVVPDDVASEITSSLSRLGADAAVAVRSSATAEDRPTASSAGQHDTYLDVVGLAAILRHVVRCWASLFSERAVTYRVRNGIDHRRVRMAVVVQRMLSPDAAGVMFTADPLSGNRTVASVEATAGLGDALVAGLVDAQVHRVREGRIIARSPGAKVLTDAQVVDLVALGRRIEAHLGCPQDIEWCLVDDELQFVQSRPITTLFPIPSADDEATHVYVSVGHQQMMTDAMTPLGLSLWQRTALAPMHAAGGRLFVDVTRALARPSSRADLLELMGRSDPLIRDAIETVLDRGDLVPSLPDAAPSAPPEQGTPPAIESDPAIVAGLVERSRSGIAELAHELDTRSGAELFEDAVLQRLKEFLFEPQSRQAIMAGMEATWWLNDTLEEWLGETNAADALAQSAPGNVTSEMGLALLDVADAIRPHPAVVAHLEDVEGDDFLDEMAELEGGREARDAICAYLDRYGMRCVGEIDITRPRWSERPSTLVPVILDNVRNFEAGEGARRFEEGRRRSQLKEHELLARVRALPDGDDRADETRRAIERLRTFVGYREYPKYDLVSRSFVYKQALLREAERLVRDHVLHEQDDVWFLTIDELGDVVRTGRADEELIARRREEFRAQQALTPPRVLTSEGEALTGSYRRDDLPVGVLVGLAVSAGRVEGRARVVLDMADADLGADDILVTTFTDPSWSPLFVTAKGLVTEVGGLMTHGAVIAREYGLPAVVGVEHATRRIRDGQRIRVDGALGYVEVLPSP